MRTAEQFAAVLDASKSREAGLSSAAKAAGLWRSAHFALHHASADLLMPAQPGSDQRWIGAIIPKRWARRAVTRNTLKRQFYAVSALRLHPSSPDFSGLPAGAYVLRLAKGFSSEIFKSATSPALKAAARAEIEALLRQAARGLNVAAPSASPAPSVLPVPSLQA